MRCISVIISQKILILSRSMYKSESPKPGMKPTFKTVGYKNKYAKKDIPYEKLSTMLQVLIAEEIRQAIQCKKLITV